MEKKQPKLFFLRVPSDQEDAGIIPVSSDRIPRVLIVRWFDLFCFCFAMLSFVVDILTDFGIAIMHFAAERYWSGALVLVFALLPSLVINLIAFVWMLDDVTNGPRRFNSRSEEEELPSRENFWSARFMMLLCGLQMGPLYFYYKALRHALQFRDETKNELERRRSFCSMVQAERDATLLRLYESFLETAPQMIIQGSILAHFVWSHGTEDFPPWMYLQCISLIASVVSISWSVVVQNRTLRMFRDDKVNLWPHEAILQFCWRLTTIASRLTVVCLWAVFLGKKAIFFFIAHFSATVVHVLALQEIDTNERTTLEDIIYTVNMFIHIFTPYNMAEGPTRYRYFIAYLIEFFEMILLFVAFQTEMSSFPFAQYIRLVVVFLFFIGIGIMMMYYKCFHPNRRLLDDTELEEISQEHGETPNAQSALNAAECTASTIKIASSMMEIVQ